MAGALMQLVAYGAQDVYTAQATSPAGMQAYMNPYIQASLAPQLQLIGQQTGINTAAQQAVIGRTTMPGETPGGVTPYNDVK